MSLSIELPEGPVVGMQIVDSAGDEVASEKGEVAPARAKPVSDESTIDDGGDTLFATQKIAGGERCKP